jgi:glutaminase
MSSRSLQGSRRAAVLLAVGALVLSGCAAAHAKGPLGASTAPDAAQLQKIVTEAHAKFKGVKDGKNADCIPILATVPSELFAVVITTRDGEVYSAGDTDYRYSIQSVSKPFTAALVMQQQGGPQAVKEKIGVEPTGLPFNSKLALEPFGVAASTSGGQGVQS